MTRMNSLTRSTALAILLTLPLGIAPLAAQESNAGDGPTTAEKIERADAPDTAETDTVLSEMREAQAAMAGSDTVVVTVGDAEILGSDVMRAIGMLPPRMRQQPAEMLLPMALQQLVMRELILDRARSEDLASDPSFVAMAEQASAEAREDATVQFWLQRELDGAVTDEAVQATYDRITQNVPGEVPPLDALRPQIEQELRRRAMNRIRFDLQAEGPEIAFAGQGTQDAAAEDTFCTAEYAPGDGSAESEFAEMDLDGDGMVSQQEYMRCRRAAAEN